MRIASFLSALCAVSVASALPRSVQVYIQPIDASSTQPSPFAEITYDPTDLSASSIESYDAPDLPETAGQVRIGIYDKKAAQWVAGTTVASVENFSKGYSPNILLSIDKSGDVVSVACRGVRIDAGQTRDFGPKAIVLPETRGKQPELNKPIVLSPEGKRAPEVQEKSFLQKYWWAIAIAAVVVLSGGGPQEK